MALSTGCVARHVVEFRGFQILFVRCALEHNAPCVRIFCVPCRTSDILQGAWRSCALRVWGAFEAELRDTDRIFFCGYSFPDADMHVNMLLNDGKL